MTILVIFPKFRVANPAEILYILAKKAVPLGSDQKWEVHQKNVRLRRWSEFYRKIFSHREK